MSEDRQGIKSEEVNASTFVQQELSYGTMSLESVRMDRGRECIQIRQIRHNDRSATMKREKGLLVRLLLEIMWRDETKWMHLLIHDNDWGCTLLYPIRR